MLPLLKMSSFLKQTIKHPRFTGAVLPSSTNLAKLIIQHADLAAAKFVVEIGPGTGVFTEHIVNNIPNANNFFTIEINPDFVELMRAKYPKITTYQDSAENILYLLQNHNQARCDRIISGLPWTAFTESMQESILEKIHQSLEPGGLFLTFAYSPFNLLKSGKIFREKLEQKFDTVYKTKSVLNIPRAFVYVCKK